MNTILTLLSVFDTFCCLTYINSSLDIVYQSFPLCSLAFCISIVMSLMRLMAMLLMIISIYRNNC